ncbi:ras-related protein Rab-24 [Plodia interpunctella]|uniref:ras-related protein Rab-24 n=1 Tax=Plodia interpunctella TaxID=58824 RepID=UPI002368318B|nr:ras-related protein Rab-24 [Plodia interpunctella]
MAVMKTPVLKVILCGEYGVGKTSLFRRFINNTFLPNSDRRSTLALDHFEKVYHVGDKDIKLQLWDTGDMERIASVTSSYYKFAEAAILVFSLDNASSFHVLSQHLLDIVTYAENAKIFLCGNKSDLKGSTAQVSDADIETFCEQCHNLISTAYNTSCKTGKGVEEMFSDIAMQLVEINWSRIELQTLEQNSFRITNPEPEDPSCSC